MKFIRPHRSKFVVGHKAPLCTPKVLFWAVPSSLSLSTAPWQSSLDVSNYCQIHKLNAFWLCKSLIHKWKFCAHVIRSSSLGPSGALHTTKRLIDQFQIDYCYLLLLGYYWTAQTTIRYKNGVHNVIYKSLQRMKILHWHHSEACPRSWQHPEHHKDHKAR